eukprot:GILI01032873.1.p1 GENE.GILI01032873.1~~GILI01032873.1.p1  ORF type:complete len:236 (+),score=74.63 GILI01032873.1:68-709(+)
MSDGLTVPFALAAGLAGAVASAKLVVTAGLAEVAAGAISMGLGGYLAAKTEIDHYDSERKREVRETYEFPEKEVEETKEALSEFGVPDSQLDTVANAITADREKWVDFMMKFELGLDKPDASRAWTSALTIAFSYLIGGLIPLIPYMCVDHVHEGLQISVIVTLIALFVFGMVKGHFTGVNKFAAGAQSTIIGGLAAAVAFGIAYAVQGSEKI